jgi:hypothetical protein
MGKVKAHIKAPFGEIILEGETPQEIIQMLDSVPQNFIERINNLVSSKLVPPSKVKLQGIVEFTTEGPVITTRKKITHYEAIGLLLFSSENRTSTAARLGKLLESSGIKCMVPARLNEMTKRGMVFKPNPSKPAFKLTVQGERWIEEEVLPKLTEK